MIQRRKAEDYQMLGRRPPFKICSAFCWISFQRNRLVKSVSEMCGQSRDIEMTLLTFESGNFVLAPIRFFD